ncbi:hypothetical protein PGT21_010515 [Puccinia graminis f. sp. tritici]|uniref:Uncharacterized protein n=1 Tax=Puccinia graminis f. sp. tritici TaxID=56615 RepID=A0A5B0N0J2_PUCGR|nr:hypothetical protein PGT21_010515 [Puccinia graminis f. sp. tritici]KAA1133414.1 hypothetical protein PGTUg99_005047 [Puccinia graminis f. sp. tritici]
MSTQPTNNRTAATTAQPTQRPSGWERDGVNGGLTSIQMLLIWLTARGNYGRWLATTFDRQERDEVCTEIQEFFQIQGSIARDTRGKMHIIRPTSGGVIDSSVLIPSQISITRSSSSEGLA